MKRDILGGNNYLLERIKPTEVAKLRDDDKIVVNRVRINNRLISLELNSNANEESIKIIRSAIENMMKQEKRSKCVVHGATMAVRDVKKVFPNIESMPQNSFVKVG